PRSTSPIMWYVCHVSAASRLVQHERMARSASEGPSSPSISEEISWFMSCSCSKRPGVCGPCLLWGLRPRYSLLPAFVFARAQLRPEFFRDGLACPENPRAHRSDRAAHDLGDFFV